MASTLLADNGVSSGSAGLKSSADSTGVLALQTTTASGTATTAVTVDNNQNVGVGVTPSAWGTLKPIQVLNASFSGYANRAYVGANWYYDATFGEKYIASDYATQYLQVSGQHRWLTAASGTAGNVISFTQAMTLDASGNLGVGTSSPTKRISVVDNQNLATGAKVSNTNSGSTAQAAWEFSNGTNTHSIGISGASYSSYGVITANNAFLYAGGGCDIAIGADGGGAIKFGTGGSIPERARIDSSGNLLVGTTTVKGKQTVVASSSVGNGYTAGFYNTYAGDVSAPGLYVAKYDNNSTTSQRFICFSIANDAAGSGQINANGASQAAFGSFSDARLKENIVDLAPQLSNIMALRPVEFDYKAGGHQTGFVAQEMLEVFPDAIGDDGSEDRYLTVTGWNKTEAILVKAIQEQQAIINAQQAALNNLTERLAVLEGK
jgi:hypothetical protein